MECISQNLFYRRYCDCNRKKVKSQGEKQLMKVNILNTIYNIYYKTEKQDEKLKKIDGYCDYSTKTIVCIKRTEKDKDVMDLGDLKFIDKRILRHELIHAFMYESGVWCNSFSSESWATNEEMTDWFAIQSPKIFKVFKELNILD